MRYELAKQLKDAGFPQGEKFENVLQKGVLLAYLRESKPDDVLLDKYEKALNALKDVYKDDEEVVHVPSLEELIKACGDEFSRLVQTFEPKGWEAKSTEINQRIVQTGLTPSEALANLWLELNKK